MTAVSVDRAKFLMRQAVERFVDETATAFEVRVRGRTPIETGHARSRWQRTNTGRTRPPVVPRGEDPGTVHDKGVTLGQTITVFNDAAYIEVLEDGHSKQAPIGMLKITAAELPMRAASFQVPRN